MCVRPGERKKYRATKYTHTPREGVKRKYRATNYTHAPRSEEELRPGERKKYRVTKYKVHSRTVGGRRKSFEFQRNWLRRAGTSCLVR